MSETQLLEQIVVSMHTYYTVVVIKAAAKDVPSRHVASAASPYKILCSGLAQESILQHHPQHLLEETVRIFEAPETDRQLLHTAIESAGLGKSSRYQLVLQSSQDGQLRPKTKNVHADGWAV